MIGLIGGTFDPIHLGHLRLAEEARVAFGLTEVRFIPCAEPVHRPAAVAEKEARATMIQIAIASNPAFALERAELDRQGPSFTVETLALLRRRYGDALPLFLILGADAFAQFHTWHRPWEILEYAHLIVATRPGTDLERELVPELAKRWRNRQTALSFPLAAAGLIFELAMVPALPVSAQLVRQLLLQGRSVRYLVPDGVLHYILDHRLYQERR